MYAIIPPLPLDLKSIYVLESGNERQRAAYRLVEKHNLLGLLAEFRGVLASTIALGIDTPSSDLDFLCEARDLTFFAYTVQRYFDELRDFCVVPTASPDISRCYSFWCDDFEIEIFGSSIRLEEQFGYRHHVVMARLINLGGEAFRDKLRGAKLAGMKSEPAIANVLALPGNPYESVAALIDAPDATLLHLLFAAGYIVEP